MIAFVSFSNLFSAKTFKKVMLGSLAAIATAFPVLAAEKLIFIYPPDRIKLPFLKFILEDNQALLS